MAVGYPLGAVESSSYRISVRYPLALQAFKVALTPPAYTGLEPSTVEGGDLDVIAGTQEFLEKLANERFEFLYQAEGAMLASADSLTKRDFPQGTVQQKDAMVYLIKARDKIRQVLRKSDPNALQAFRNFDRSQLQKLRKPRDENQQSEELAARLRQLSGQEQIVYATLSGIKLADSVSEPGQRKPGQEEPSKQGGSQGSPGQEGASATDGNLPQTAAKRANGQPGGTGRREVEKLQQEIVNEAYDLARIIKGLDELPDLADARMGQATKKAEEVSSALARGNSEEAARAAGEAADMFKELARQVEGLLGREAAQRIAAARDISAWHRDAEASTRDLPRESGTAPSGYPAADDLLKAMREAGWGSAEGAWHWSRPGPYYVGPEAYYSHLSAIVEGLQGQVYELLLGDLIAAGDEAVPPEYEKLVERYFQLLSESPGGR